MAESVIHRLRRDIPEMELITVATTTTAARAAVGTFFAGAGDIDGQRAAVEFLAVQTVDGLFGLLRRGHGDEGKSAGTIGHAVHHQVGLGDGAVGGKGVLEVVFSGVEGKISDKQFVAHVIIVLD